MTGGQLGRAVPTGAAAVALAWSAARAARRTVSDREERVFRSFNECGDGVAAPVWLVMQAGSLSAVFGAGAVMRRRHRTHEACAIVVGGTALWGAVKVVKPPIGRGRPSRLLDAVHIRGAEPSGLGYPSGHAAIATTLALLTTTSTAGRAVALSVAAVTGAARMYVGAHLPLDVVGGFAIGTLSARAIDAVVDGLGAGTKASGDRSSRRS